MNNYLIASLVATTFLVNCAAFQPGVHNLTHTVRVRDENGTPVPDVPFMVSVGGVPAKSSLWTNVNGEVRFKLQVPDSAAELVITPLAVNLGVDPYAEDEPAQKFREAMLSKDLKKWYVAPLVGSEQTSISEITATRSITISGKIVSPGATPQVIASRSGGRSIYISKDANFRVGGFKRGETGVFFVAREGSSVVLAQPVSVPAAAPLDVVVPLADISWPVPPPVLRDVDIVLQEYANLPRLCGAIGSHVSLISADFQLLYTFEYDSKTGKARSLASSQTTSPPQVAPGTYYVMLGDFILGGADLGYEALRAGRSAELDAAGFPKLIVPSGGAEVPAITINGGALWTKMKSLVPQ